MPKTTPDIWALVSTFSENDCTPFVRIFRSQQEAIDHGWEFLEKLDPKAAAKYPKTDDGLQEFAADCLPPMDWFFVERATADENLFALPAIRS